MATESVLSQLGLFTTPEQYQQSQLRQLYQDQLAQARLSPVEQASFNIGAGAQRAGDVLGRALGAEDPMLQMISQRQAILREIDRTDPQSIIKGAQALGQIGDAQTASQLVKDAQEAAFKQSQIVKNLREGNAAMLTPEQRNFAQARQEGYKGSFNQWLTEQNKSKATNIGITQKQEEAITKSNVEAFGNLRDEAIAAAKTIESVQAIKPLINQAFTGFAADTKLTAAQIADTFGIPIQGTSETEKLRSIQNNLKIGNSTVLKGAISDKDMAILGQAIGQGNTTAGGIRGIINDLEKNALISQAKYQRANQFQQAGKLSQYDFVEGDKAASSEVNAKLKRLRELESKASQGAK